MFKKKQTKWSDDLIQRLQAHPPKTVAEFRQLTEDAMKECTENGANNAANALEMCSLTITLTEILLREEGKL